MNITGYRLSPLEPSNLHTTLTCDTLPDKFIVGVDMVEKQLSRLKINKAAGPDALPTWILRDFAPSLVGPVAAL